MLNRMRRSKIYLIGVSVGESTQNEREAVFEELMAEKFLGLINI